MTVFDIDPDIVNMRARVDQQLRQTGCAIIERAHRRKDGTTFPVELNLHRVRLDREYDVAVARDITERKRAEKALRASELRFRAVFERSPVGISLMDSRSGKYLHVNPKFCEIAGRSEEELLRSDVENITHPDDIAQGSDYRRQLAEEKLTSFEMDKRYVRPDGSVRWVRVLVVPMWGKGATHRLNMALVEDITEQKQADDPLRESERRQQLAL